MSSIQFLKGPRLYLRPMDEADLPRCQRWVNDADVRQWLLITRPLDMVAERNWYQGHDRGPAPTDVVMAVVLYEGDAFIGTVGLHHISWLDRTGEIGILIGEKEHWGQGYGRDALELVLQWSFHTLDFARIDSRVLAGNIRSHRLHLGLGFKEEGLLRKKHFRHGKRVDEIAFGLLREEWEACQALTDQRPV